MYGWRYDASSPLEVGEKFLDPDVRAESHRSKRPSVDASDFAPGLKLESPVAAQRGSASARR